jgi:hypothetical protein
MPIFCVYVVDFEDRLDKGVRVRREKFDMSRAKRARTRGDMGE